VAGGKAMNIATIAVETNTTIMQTTATMVVERRQRRQQEQHITIMQISIMTIMRLWQGMESKVMV
jgi:hypothetical protein